MSYIREFIFPAIPIVFELLLRVSFLMAPSWEYYVNSATIFVSIGIWTALTSLRVPSIGKIKTDAEYNAQVSRIKYLLLTLGVFGFMLFGAQSFGDALSARYGYLSLELSRHKQWFFAISAIVYAAITFGYVALNRSKIESLYRA